MVVRQAEKGSGGGGTFQAEKTVFVEVEARESTRQAGCPSAAGTSGVRGRVRNGPEEELSEVPVHCVQG